MKKLSNIITIILMMILICFSFSGCGEEDSNDVISGNEIPGSNNAVTDDSEIPEDLLLFVVININVEDERIIVESINERKKLVLTYTGGTSIKNRYGDEISIAKLVPGEIVELEYNRGTQKISKIEITDEAWEYTQVTEFELDVDYGILTTGSQNYSLDSVAVAFSNNLEIGLDEINEKDEITLKGYGNIIYSIIVTRGHGYIVLENTEGYLGGFIDIGNEIVTEIENGMVITAPEGTYMLTVTKNGSGGSQEIVVLRDAEIIVDISRLQTALEMGSIKFNITPSTAKLYIDGTYTNYTEPVSLSYGNHSFKIVKTGYNTLVGTINVNKTYTSKTFTMNQAETTTTQTTSEGTTTQQVTISEPLGANIYFDNVYKGIAPITFDVTPGSHTVVLRKTGYTSKSYTITIPDDGEDVEYGFDDLVAS